MKIASNKEERFSVAGFLPTGRQISLGGVINDSLLPLMHVGPLNSNQPGAVEQLQRTIDNVID